MWAEQRSAIYMLLVLTIVLGLNYVDRNMFGLLLPLIKEDIQLSDFALGFLSGPAFILVYSVAGVPIAWIADRTNRRNIIVIGLTFWSAATAATGAVLNMTQLIIARMSLGMGEATHTAPASAMIADAFPLKNRPMAFAVFTSGGPLGIMLAFPAIGWISQSYGWRFAFFTAGVLGLMVAILMFSTVIEPVRHETKGGKKDAFLSVKESLIVSFRSRSYVIFLIGGTCFGISFSAMLTWLPTFLIRVHDLDTQQVSSYLAVYRGGFGVVTGLSSGLLVTILNRFDERWLAWAPAGFFFAMVPAQLLLLFSDQSAGWQIGLALDTLCQSAVIPIMFALMLSLVDSRLRAFGSSFYLLIFHIVGNSAGPLVVGAVNDILDSTYGTIGIRYSLLIAPLSALMAGILFLLLSGALVKKEN